jgi:hypothetical protein
VTLDSTGVAAELANTLNRDIMDRERQMPPAEPQPGKTSDEAEGGAHTPTSDPRDGTAAANPPRTTTGNVTAPKFGSAGGGGAELGPEAD